MPTLFVLLILLQAEPPSQDTWIGGYAGAILERDFDARGKIDVRQGVLTLTEDTLKDIRRTGLKRSSWSADWQSACPPVGFSGRRSEPASGPGVFRVRAELCPAAFPPCDVPGEACVVAPLLL
jgi:hypothetical protein